MIFTLSEYTTMMSKFAIFSCGFLYRENEATKFAIETVRII